MEREEGNIIELYEVNGFWWLTLNNWELKEKNLKKKCLNYTVIIIFFKAVSKYSSLEVQNV